MTPQQLMDMPGAGNAEKWLRKAGKWEKTALEWLYAIPEEHCTYGANAKLNKAIEILENQQ